MAGPVHIHFLPAHVAPPRLAGATVVVVDVLRATTTITYALEAGAERIAIFATPQEARDTFGSLPPRVTILAGERGGVRIDGFHLGNSPGEYSPRVVSGKTLLFTTTNGTVAALHAGRAARVLFGCFANLSSLTALLLADARPVHILCSGTGGAFSLDDCIFAGSLAKQLAAGGGAFADRDLAALAIAGYEQACLFPGGLAAALCDTRGGRGLVELGFIEDINVSVRIDTCRAVGELNIGMRVITNAAPATPPRGKPT